MGAFRVWSKCWTDYRFWRSWGQSQGHGKVKKLLRHGRSHPCLYFAI